MPSKSATVKNQKQYGALKDKGMSKERAAKIANSPGDQHLIELVSTRSTTDLADIARRPCRRLGREGRFLAPASATERLRPCEDSYSRRGPSWPSVGSAQQNHGSVSRGLPAVEPATIGGGRPAAWRTAPARAR